MTWEDEVRLLQRELDRAWSSLKLEEHNNRNLPELKPANTEDDFKIPTFENGSELIQNSQRNLTNLFEFPIFFYAVCIMIYVTGNVDGYFVLLATWFFWLRVAHTVTHIFYNKIIPGIAIPVRTLFWLPSTIILGWMAYRACSMMM